MSGKQQNVVVGPNRGRAAIRYVIERRSDGRVNLHALMGAQTFKDAAVAEAWIRSHLGDNTYTLEELA